jgi:hypothetical protein
MDEEELDLRRGVIRGKEITPGMGRFFSSPGE